MKKSPVYDLPDGWIEDWAVEWLRAYTPTWPRIWLFLQDWSSG